MQDSSSKSIPTNLVAESATFISDIRAIAMYLPQYHAIYENNQWWGENFTEWTNVRRANPQYHGHYQPHVPHHDIGYYDLNDENILIKQTELARKHGIEGFCFYYYWFQGKRLLEMPTDRMLASGKPDFPFCYCWANENWTRTWDGGDKEILIAQHYNPKNNENIIRDLIPSFLDKRYIKINDRPLFIVYRPLDIPDFATVAERWRHICREEGVGEIYLASMRSFAELDPTELGLDAVIQFPPLLSDVKDTSQQVELKEPGEFKGHIYDYRDLAIQSAFVETTGYKLFNGICPSWDNTARRMERGTSWIHSSPENYYQWLKVLSDKARIEHEPQERFIFINAWNEWAEGCHLEPDEKYGYAWLNATRMALSRNSKKDHGGRPNILVVGHDAARAGAQILLLTMLKEWKSVNQYDFQLILLRDGVLRSDFEKICDTLVLEDYPNDLAANKILKRFLNKAPDVILANTVVVGPFLSNIKHFEVPIITYVHELQKSIERWASGEIMAATLCHTDHFIAVSEAVAENLKLNHGISDEKISCANEYIKTGHSGSLNVLATIRHELGIKDSEKIIFGCGTMDWRKGIDLFVKVANEVLPRVEEAHFVWIGGDTTDDSSIQARKLAKDGRIRFIGERTNPRDYLALGEIFFLSSREDPFPLVALEAADAGSPIVCFEGAGGMPEFVEKDAGVVVPYEDVRSAAEAIIQVLLDSNKRQLMGDTARNKIRQKHDSVAGSRKISDLCLSLSQIEKTTVKCDQPQIDPPLISVIVPNYNHEKYLESRLKSIANQSHKNIEIILLDDASTDNSVEILERFTLECNNAQLFTNAVNSGSTFHQWKKGIEIAKGKYVWIAESDDLAHPFFLEKMIQMLELDDDISFAYCKYLEINKNLKVMGFPSSWYQSLEMNKWGKTHINDGNDEIKKYLIKRNTILNASGVVLRNFEGAAKLISTEFRLCGDWFFWIQLLKRGKVAYNADTYSYWRTGSSYARSKIKGELELIEGEKILRDTFEYLKESKEWNGKAINDFKSLIKNDI